MKRVVVLVWLSGMSAAIADRALAAATRPNIVFILADDLGGYDPGLFRQHLSRCEAVIRDGSVTVTPAAQGVEPFLGGAPEGTRLSLVVLGHEG